MKINKTGFVILNLLLFIAIIVGLIIPLKLGQ